jgi:hypothetical protein
LLAATRCSGVMPIESGFWTCDRSCDTSCTIHARSRQHAKIPVAFSFTPTHSNQTPPCHCFWPTIRVERSEGGCGKRGRRRTEKMKGASTQPFRTRLMNTPSPWASSSRAHHHCPCSWMAWTDPGRKLAKAGRGRTGSRCGLGGVGALKQHLLDFLEVAAPARVLHPPGPRCALPPLQKWLKFRSRFLVRGFFS